jgi:antitoxin HicB
MKKRLEHYLKLPYTVLVHRAPDGMYEVSIAELDGCLSHGATLEEALRMIEDAKRCWIEANLEAGGPIPEPDREYLTAMLELYDLHLTRQPQVGGRLG